MADTPEKAVKRKVTAILKSYGAYYFYPVTGGYGASGVPDIVGCYRGRFFGIECKAGKNTTNTLQERNLTAIREQGGAAMVVDEDNAQDVEDILKQWSQQC